MENGLLDFTQEINADELDEDGNYKENFEFENYNENFESENLDKESKNKEVQLIDNKPKLILPNKGRLISEVASDLGKFLGDKKALFYRKNINEIVELGDLENSDSEIFTGFIEIKPSRLVCLSEKYITPTLEKVGAYGTSMIEKSMTSELCNIIINSPQFQKKLPEIKRIFSFPIPIFDKENKELTFPKSGYDDRFKSWQTSSININKDMPLDEAKDIICNKVFGEFCFKTEQDKTNAIAGFITPSLRGLFSKFNIRTPLFFYLANRERAGKDYCALIRELVYTGVPLIESPISTGEKFSSNDELRKKISGYMINGRQLLHFQNNRGYLDNAILESLATSEYFTDRVLGKNETITFPNELDISLSGNIGISYTADFVNRCRFVRLFLDIEDANARKFANPDLHGWIIKNRGLILSAIYSIVNHWFNQDCPDGSITFSSFPEWAKICGGIMEAAELGNPCVQDKEALSIGGDTETSDIKELFELCYNKHENIWIKRVQIIDIIKENELFGYLDLSKQSDLTKLGIKLSKFTGRILSDIRLVIKDEKIKGARRDYKFVNIKYDLGKYL